jgi:hypothetical protein
MSMTQNYKSTSGTTTKDAIVRSFENHESGQNYSQTLQKDDWDLHLAQLDCVQILYRLRTYRRKTQSDQKAAAVAIVAAATGVYCGSNGRPRHEF